MADFDVVVIGSGFGGAVAACRLAEAGSTVLVLERGRRWKRQEYPSVSRDDWIWDDDNPHQANGWFDIRLFNTISTVAGAGVGGGSLHYANVLINATPDLFEDGWPEEITFAELNETYYPKVDAVLKPQLLPRNQWSNHTKLLQEAAKKAGFEDRFRTLELGIKFNEDYDYDASQEPNPDDSVFVPNDQGIEQGFCVHLGQCLLGCPVEARNTSALNYIPRAEKSGAEVRPLHIVRYIHPENGHYRVHYDRIIEGRLVRGHVSARIVVVGAGSLGSSEILLRCRNQYRTLPRISSMLGHRWSSNANYLTFANHPNHDVYPTRGPSITAAVSFLDRSDHTDSRFFIEDLGLADLLDDFRDNLTKPLAGAQRFERPLRTIHGELGDRLFNNLMLWFAQGRDEPTGRLRLRRAFLGILGSLRLNLRWDRTGARRVLDAIQEIHTTLAKNTDGEIFFQPRNALITAHPLGGCPMGQTPQEGVVDHRGAVFGYENLYVADGAILPKAIGHNPSKTIAALAERIADKIVEKER